MTVSPLVSVVVIFDRGELDPCLPSLLAQEGIDFEILAVVSSKEDRGRAPENDLVKWIAIENRNPAFRRNAAAMRARGDYLAFIDDDASAPPDWLARGVGFLDDTPIYAGVGGPNLCPDDAGPAERITELVLAAPLIGGGSRAYRGGGQRKEARPGEIHLVNFIARRDWFDRVNGLNEALGYGGEDTEFLYQAGKLGGRFIFDPELFVWHRRRAFGMPLFRQRFRLRRQSARLFAAYPSIYARSLGFWLALLLPPAAAALAAAAWQWLGPAGIGALAAAYAILTAALSLAASAGRPVLFLFAPALFLLHHAVNLAGLWLGLIESVLGIPFKSRHKIRRTMDSCSI